MSNETDTEKHALTRRRFVKLASGAVVRAGSPISGNILALLSPSDAHSRHVSVAEASKALIVDDPFDLFWNCTNRYTPVLDWLVQHTEFFREVLHADRAIIRRLVDDYRAGKPEAITDIAYKQLFYEYYRKAENEGFRRCAAAFQNDAPSVEKLREIFTHPVFMESEEYLMFAANGGVENAIKRFHAMSLWSPQRMQNYVDSWIRAYDTMMQELTTIAGADPRIQEEMSYLRGEGYPERIGKTHARPRNRYPGFGSAYRMNEYPIPADYYSGGKVSWVEKIEPKLVGYSRD
jgi:hypothetical protein